MRLRRNKVKSLYKDAIFQVFGAPGDKELKDWNRDLKAAIRRDVHLSKDAPGQWNPWSVLEIYCEGGIPNATDVHDMSWYGVEGGGLSCNSEKWQTVDGLVNLMLEALGHHERYFHEPYNGAVVSIIECPPF